MERIASFQVDHTKIGPGVYVSRIDGDVVTYDLRMKKPNGGDYLPLAGIHTTEHLFATYARNSAIGRNIIYVGPMGCRTGFYLLVRGASHDAVLDMLREAFRFIADFEGDIPGVSEEECGNWREHSLEQARQSAFDFLPVLEIWNDGKLSY